jgi:ankyrin repeat protein
MEGLPPLHLAAAHGDKEALQTLLADPKTDVNQQAGDGTTALAQASFYGEARCVKLLIKHGAKCSVKDRFDNLPIHLATVGDHRKSVEMIIDGGGRVNRRDGHGLCPLHLAIIRGFDKMVKLLLERGARVDKLTRGAYPMHPLHPLHLAARKGNTIIMRQLLAFKPTQVNCVDAEGRTAMFNAVECDFPEIVSSLIMHGASVTIGTKAGESPLSLAIKRGYEDICHTLCTNGADVSLRYTLPHNPNRHSVAVNVSSSHPSTATNSSSNPSQHSIASSNPSLHRAASSNLHVSVVPSTVEPSTNQDDNTSVGSNLSDTSVENDLDLISQADRYGHIAKNVPENPRSRKLLRKELQRAKKWSDMISNWPTYSTKRADKVLSRSAKGVPDRVRGVVWKLLAAGVPAIPPSSAVTPGTLALQIDANADKYRRLLQDQSKWTTQIDLDVNRAARNHMMFRERYGKGQRALFSILKAYSSEDTELGYCQGMSDMTALLLKYETEEESFWMLERLMSAPKWNMRNLFLPGFPKLQQAFYVHDALLSQYCSTLARHLAKENIMAPFYATKWYLLAFLDIFPFEVTVRLWDLLLAEGYEIVYSIAVSVMRNWEGDLLGKGFDKIMAFMRGLETIVIDVDKFIAFITKNRIPTRKIRHLEDEYNKKFVH